MTKPRNHLDDLRGASRLAIDATKGITDLVEAMHRTIVAGPRVLGQPLDRTARVVLGPIYGGIRAMTKLVGDGIDGALAQISPLLGPGVPAHEHEAVLAALNGVLGDYLCETGNPLAITMSLCHAGRPLVLETEALRRTLGTTSGKLLVLVHGSCVNDLQWNRRGHDHGAALARELGYTPIYVYYNSGLHISANGHSLATLLEALVRSWPVAIDELVLLGHSMGGLVSRSACHVAELAGHGWRRSLGKLICLGSPHHGAPLERGGSWVDFMLGVSRYSAPFARLGKIRSAGVTDLRFGIVRAQDWAGRDRFARGSDPRTPLPLPIDVACYAIAGSLSKRATERPSSDGLVPVESALGRSASPELELRFPAAQQSIAFATGHLDLLDRPEVYATIARWLGVSDPRPAP
jgi:pimeloyl-ACP methyl ester carboxylesterase